MTGDNANFPGVKQAIEEEFGGDLFYPTLSATQDFTLKKCGAGKEMAVRPEWSPPT